MENPRTTARRRREARRVRLFFLLLAAFVCAACFFWWHGRRAGAAPSAPASSPSSASVPPLAESPAPVSAGDWNMVLVNPWHPLPAERDITLTQLKNSQAVDERCYPDLQDMMDACRAAGLDPLICSSYRSYEKQERLFNEQVETYLAQGYSQEDARAEAGKAVAVPGTSEHQLGLAVDIVDTANQILDENQEHTAVQQWLLKNSWKYGFILRYPTDKSAVTGIMYEPWHYRYVGKAAAKEIYEQDLCLEEYLEQLGA